MRRKATSSSQRVVGVENETDEMSEFIVNNAQTLYRRWLNNGEATCSWGAFPIHNWR
ncbi:hypothetical protein STFR1_10658 [Bacillus vallismortis]